MPSLQISVEILGGSEGEGMGEGDSLTLANLPTLIAASRGIGRGEAGKRQWHSLFWPAVHSSERILLMDGPVSLLRGCCMRHWM